VQPKFRVSSQVFEDNLALFNSSLFENSSATSQQGAIGQVQVQVSLQVSKDVLSEFISSLFANSCCLVTQKSPDQVAFSAADTFPSPSPKLLPGVPPEGVSVESDEGVGRESVCGYASASDCYPPTLTSLLHPLLPTSCSRKRDICEDVGEQCVAECCGGFLDPTLASLSPHLSLPPRIFVCDYFDTRNTLSFILTLTSSPDCVSGLWSEGVPPPPGTTVFPDEDTVDVNQPSDLDPKVSAQSSPSSQVSARSSPSSVSSCFRYGLPVMRCIDSYEHFSGFLPFLWLVHLLLLVSAYLLSPFRSLVTVVKFCFSIQVWLLRN
jgi:hypothetical protein